jgi:hypothetical protein
MVEREANIDLLFRNGLRDYEVLPPSDVWEGIQPAISGKRSFIGYRIAASVAVLISLALGTFYLTSRADKELAAPSLSVNNFVNPESSREDKNFIPAATTPAMDMVTASEVFDKPVSENTINPVNNYYLPQPGLYTSFTERTEKAGRTRNLSSVNIDPIANKAYPPGDGKMTNSDLELDKGDGTGFEPGRWSVGALVIPSYYSSFSLSSNDPASELIKAEDAAVSYSGGFAFSYKVSKRISVQTGIYYSAIGQKVTGVDTYTGFSRYNNSKGAGMFSVVTSSGTITSTNRDLYLADNNTNSRVLSNLALDVFDPVKADLSYISNSIHQDFNYLEIPFVMKYKLFDRKLDFNITGGLSYNLLVNNTSYAMTGGEKFYIGNTGNLSPVTFSSSLGMGLEYSFSKRLYLNLEPTFRYYMTPIGGLAGSSIHPYSFGVLSGISYRF